MRKGRSRMAEHESESDRAVFGSVRRTIIRWFSSYGRQFDWRKNADPFNVLIAEMLLRRTTASAVARVYGRFVTRFGTPAAIASARESELMKLLKSLGLQTVRAQQILRTGVILVEEFNGTVPKGMDALLSLPGLGRYGASAVMNFAFGVHIPVVDGNVIHLMNRVFGLGFRGPLDESAWRFMADFGGRNQEKQLYWGIIDMVAALCLRRNPRCTSCPLLRYCKYGRRLVK